MNAVDILRVIATWLLWAIIPFQWYSIIRSHRLIKQYEEKNVDLDRLIHSYQKRLSELGKGNPFEDFD